MGSHIRMYLTKQKKNMQKNKKDKINLNSAHKMDFIKIYAHTNKYKASLVEIREEEGRWYMKMFV